MQTTDPNLRKLEVNREAATVVEGKTHSSRVVGLLYSWNAIMNIITNALDLKKIKFIHLCHRLYNLFDALLYCFCSAYFYSHFYIDHINIIIVDEQKIKHITGILIHYWLSTERLVVRAHSRMPAVSSSVGIFRGREPFPQSADSDGWMKEGMGP